MDIRAKDPRARDLVCICIQEGHSAWELKYIKNEAKNLYKKLKKSRDKHLFQTGQWDQMRIIDFAVLGGHNVLFDTLVKWLHVDPNIPDRDYNKLPLHHAAQEGHDSMVKTLLEKCNSPIDARDKCDSTPLSYAILHGQNSTVDLLLDHGASTQLSNFCGRPMHCAAFHGNIHAVKRMHGVNAAAAEAVVFGFCTPILAAISGGSFDCTKFLAEVTDITGIPLMYKAIACTNSESAALKIVETLLQNGVNANLLDEELFESLPIISAAKRGWESVVDALLIPTDQVPGIDWSVGGLIGHVNTEEFKEADEVQRETRLGHLKTRIVQDLDNMHHLSAEVICQSLRFDMGDNTWYSWTCLCQLIRKFAESARPVPCSIRELISIGCYSIKKDELDMALVVAKACLALQPDSEDCITFHQHVLGLQEGTSSSGRS